MRRGQQAVHEIFVSLRIFVGKERLNVLQFRRQPGQIETQAPDEVRLSASDEGFNPSVCRRARTKLVDRVFDPRLATHFRHGRAGEGIVSQWPSIWRLLDQRLRSATWWSERVLPVFD